MVDRDISSQESPFRQGLFDEMQEIANSESLHEQLYHSLAEQIHALSCDGMGEQLQDKLLQLIKHFTFEISSKTKGIIQSCSLEMSEHRLKIKQLQHCLHQRDENIESLTEMTQVLTAKINNWQIQYENLKGQYTEVQEKYELRLREVKREKKQIKQTFRMAQENTEIERALLENIQFQKEEISVQIISQKRLKQTLSSELEQIKKKCIETQRKLQASASKLTWEEKRMKKLEQEAVQKDSLIHKLMQQIQYIHKQQKDQQTDNKSQSNLAGKSFIEQHHDQESKKYMSLVESFKLSDQIINIHEGYEIQTRKSLVLQVKKDEVEIQHMEINRSLASNEQNQPDIPTSFIEIAQAPLPCQIKIPDFYLAHFLLTSQAIKIKLNCQKYLSVDLMNHYHSVVRDRVPFHLWDEWIRSKLEDLAQ